MRPRVKLRSGVMLMSYYLKNFEMNITILNLILNIQEKLFLAGILGNYTEPLFIKQNSAAELDFDKLENTIDYLITKTVENNHNDFNLDIIFQHKGAPR